MKNSKLKFIVTFVIVAIWIALLAVSSIDIPLSKNQQEVITSLMQSSGNNPSVLGWMAVK